MKKVFCLNFLFETSRKTDSVEFFVFFLLQNSEFEDKHPHPKMIGLLFQLKGFCLSFFFVKLNWVWWFLLNKKFSQHAKKIQQKIKRNSSLAKLKPHIWCQMLYRGIYFNFSEQLKKNIKIKQKTKGVILNWIICEQLKWIICEQKKTEGVILNWIICEQINWIICEQLKMIYSV